MISEAEFFSVNKLWKPLQHWVHWGVRQIKDTHNAVNACFLISLSILMDDDNPSPNSTGPLTQQINWSQ